MNVVLLERQSVLSSRRISISKKDVARALTVFISSEYEPVTGSFELFGQLLSSINDWAFTGLC